MMTFKEIVLKNRSYRRFHQDEPVAREVLIELIDLARLSPSAQNKQPLKYKIVNDAATCAKLFPLLGWAGYLTEWPGPAEGERPPAYIVMVGDTSLGASYQHDKGIAGQTILLGAAARGLGGCFVATIDRAALAALLGLEARYEILYVLPIGRPKETVILEEMKGGDVKYWRDADGAHHVPKRSLDEILL